MKKTLLTVTIIYLVIAGGYPLILHYGPRFIDGMEQQPLPANYWEMMPLGFPLLALMGFMIWYLNLPMPDKRYAGTPPGVIAPAGTPTVRVGVIETPVRFSPPEVDLMTAAVATDEIPFGNHLAAVLTTMSINGSLVIQQQPRKIIQGPKPPTNDIERTLWSFAEPPMAGWSDRQTNASMKHMSDALAREFHRIWNAGTIREKVSLWPRRLVLLGLAVLSGGAAVAVTMANIPKPGTPPRDLGVVPQVIVLLIAMTLVLAVGVWISLQLPQRWRRTALGTAIKDQVDGFALYLSRAEADQEKFEESVEIYRGFIPWAALFFVTNRWTKKIVFRFPYELFGMDEQILPVRWQEAGELPVTEEEAAAARKQKAGKA